MANDGLKSSVLRAEIEQSREAGDSAADGGEAAERRPVEELGSEELVERYAGLVGRVAKDIHEHYDGKFDYDDLRAYGFEGLLEAHGNYDPDRGVSFSTFAFYRIRGAIYDGLREERWSKRDQAYGVAARAAVNEHMAGQADVRAGVSRTRSFEESLQQIDRMVGDTVTILFVRQLDLEELERSGDEEPFDDVDRRQRVELIDDALQALEQHERDVVVRYHVEEQPMSTIAEDLDLSKGWISRVNSRAIDKIRAHVAENTERLEIG